MDRRARALALTLTALAVVRCGPTEILVGDVPGLARIVAGVAGDSGRGAAEGNALTEPLAAPMGVAAGPGGVFYVADAGNRVVRRITAGGREEIVAGSPTCTVFVVGRVTAQQVCLKLPTAVALDSSGTVLIVADRSQHVVWRVDLALDSVWPILGTGVAGKAADSAVASTAPVFQPTDVAITADGTVYVAETGNSRILAIEPQARGTAPRVIVFAGRDPVGYGGDGGPPRQARLFAPQGVAVDGDTVYIGDTGNHVVRRVAGGIIETAAGTGQRGYAGDGGPARVALLDGPTRVSRVGGLIVFSDHGNHRVRSVSLSTGLVASFLGTGDSALAGDQLNASETTTSRPEGLCAGGPHVYAADAGHHVVRRVLVP
jgi:serine/threonine-protein kinase